MTGRQDFVGQTDRRGLALFILACATALIILAWPRLHASLSYLPVDTALQRHWSGETPNSEQLAALSERARIAFRQHDHYRYLDGLSVLEYLQAQDAAFPAEQRALLLQAAAATALESASRAPMKPAAWLRVALARTSLGQPPEMVVPPLVMSVYTGRVEPSLILLRLQLLYDLQRHLSPDDQGMLIDQTLLTWRLQPRALAQRVRTGAIPYHRLAMVLLPGHGAVLDEIDEVIRGTVR